MSTGPQLAAPAVLTPAALTAAAQTIRARWPNAPYTATYPGLAFADLMTAAVLLERAAGMLAAVNVEEQP